MKANFALYGVKILENLKNSILPHGTMVPFQGNVIQWLHDTMVLIDQNQNFKKSFRFFINRNLNYG